MSESVPCGKKLYGISGHPDIGCETATSADETGVRRLLVFLTEDKRKP